MGESVPKGVAELLDRDAIRDVVYRFARAVDRRDFNALRDVYWPDAVDEHGAFNGPVSEFFDWVDERTRGWDRTVHYISQITVDLKGDEAGAETYYMCVQKKPKPEGGWFDELVGGRYVDRMTKRDGAWRIQHRINVFEWFRHFPDSFDFKNSPFGKAQLGGHKPHDPLYSLIGEFLT